MNFGHITLKFEENFVRLTDSDGNSVFLSAEQSKDISEYLLTKVKTSYTFVNVAAW